MTNVLLDKQPTQETDGTTNGRSFFIESNNIEPLPEFGVTEQFWVDNQDIMPEQSVAVWQEKSQTTSDSLPTHTTVIFSAKHSANNIYVWQLSEAQEGARTIWQVSVKPNEISGVMHQLDQQGRLSHTEDLGVETAVEKLKLIFSYAELAKPDMERLRNQRQRIGQELAALCLSHEMLLSVENRLRDGTSITVQKTMRLSDELFETECSALRERFRHTGMTALQPYKLST